MLATAYLSYGFHLARDQSHPLEIGFMEKRVRHTADCSENKDCISELPDEIIVCILSRLTLREAVVTSVLSRRWKYLWAFITTLDFYPRITSDYIRPYKRGATEEQYLDYLIEIERPRYVNWVNRVLGQYRGPTIDEFRVWIDLDKSYAGDINRWIKFAMQKRVQRLQMHFCGFSPSNAWNFERYTFPDQLLFRCQTRGPSQTQLCWDAFVGFKSLRDLDLKQVNVSWEVLEYFLANCPNLERLVVHRSENLEKLRVVGSSLPLKHLEVYMCLRLKYIKICDTNLVSFKYEGPRRRLLVNNAPLLVDVCISLHSNSTLRQLSSCFSQLQILTLIPSVVLDNIKPRFFTGLKNLKKLVLEIRQMDDESLLLYTPLIETCSYLQIFVLKLIWPACVEREGRVIEAVKCPHNYLKVVEICGYYGGASDFELAMYFIENATKLEKLIIDPRYQSRSCRGVRIVDTREGQEKIARHYAKLQLEGEVPSRIKLEIL